MTPDHLSRPLLAGLAVAACLVLTDGAAAVPGAGALPPLAPAPGAALLRDLEILHLRSHAAAERLAELDVGVHPVPAPRRWGRR